MMDGRGSREMTERIGGMARDVSTLPPDLPVPKDDGAADHLRGAAVPSLALASTSRASIDLARLAAAPAVLFFYPRTRGRGKSSGPEWAPHPRAGRRAAP